MKDIQSSAPEDILNDINDELDDIFDEDDGQIKAHYLFYLSLTYIFNIALLVILLDFNFPKLKFMSFFNTAFNHAEYIYLWAYRLIMS
mgnify:CR=1 FL=1